MKSDVLGYNRMNYGGMWFSSLPLQPPVTAFHLVYFGLFHLTIRALFLSLIPFMSMRRQFFLVSDFKTSFINHWSASFCNLCYLHQRAKVQVHAPINTPKRALGSCTATRYMCATRPHTLWCCYCKFLSWEFNAKNKRESIQMWESHFYEMNVTALTITFQSPTATVHI